MKAGIEIHQRLATSKLFCNCKSAQEFPKGFSIFRKQRAVAGELGVIDAAALQEFMRKRQFSYETAPGCSCLVESDDEPPHPVNEEAVDTVLEACMLLNCKIVDEIQFMRKTVIDGSNTSGFQRTSIVGMGGKIDTSKGQVGILSVCLEEESAGILKEEGGLSRFSLDRLGMPLIEIATDASIKDGEHAQEVAEKLGSILRATGKVQRGIGTIRQDVNVSTENGARIEIKGAQELKLIGEMVKIEVGRQDALVEIYAELKSRFGGKIEFDSQITPLSDVFSKTQSKMLLRITGEGGKIFGIRLPHFAGLLGKNISEHRRFGTELSDYAKADAGVGGLIHSDEDFSKYGITPEEKKQVEEALGACGDDAYIIVADKEEKARAALGAAKRRALLGAVPEETRRALPDGASAYMRPLPGKARLYPETDVPPFRVKGDRLGNLKKELPMMPEQRLARLESLLGKELAKKMFNSREELTFEFIINTSEKIDPPLVAVTLQDTIVNLRREGVAVDKLKVHVLQYMFVECASGLFVKAAIPELLKYLAENPNATSLGAVQSLSLQKISGPELEKLIENEGRNLKEIMKKYRNRVDAKEVSDLLKR
jgi:glutamyl-tRNA(Gln) amidotransferase subunit E